MAHQNLRPSKLIGVGLKFITSHGFWRSVIHFNPSPREVSILSMLSFPLQAALSSAVPPLLSTSLLEPREDGPKKGKSSNPWSYEKNHLMPSIKSILNRRQKTSWTKGLWSFKTFKLEVSSLSNEETCMNLPCFLSLIDLDGQILQPLATDMLLSALNCCCWNFLAEVIRLDTLRSLDVWNGECWVREETSQYIFGSQVLVFGWPFWEKLSFRIQNGSAKSAKSCKGPVSKFEV